MKLVKPHMKIQKASEDYLESMLMMKEQHGYIRSVDVADHLGVTKPSVTYATKRLRENGYIEMDRDGLITLTDRGMAIAAKMLDRHHTLTKFLIALGVDEKTAEEDACKIEQTSASRHTTRSASTQGSTFKCRINGPVPKRCGAVFLYL